MHLLRVTDAGSPQFGHCMATLRASISGDTQLPQQHLQNLLAGGRYQLFAGGEGEDAQGMALVYFPDPLPFAWLDYFAIRSDLRGLGLGGALFAELVQAAVHRTPAPDWMFLEVDDNREGDSGHQSTCARRIGFYRRLGARLLENVPYKFPSALGPPIPMRLMACPLRPGATLSSYDLQRAVEDVFANIHGRKKEDELLCWFRESLPKEIEVV